MPEAFKFKDTVYYSDDCFKCIAEHKMDDVLGKRYVIPAGTIFSFYKLHMCGGVVVYTKLHPYSFSYRFKDFEELFIPLTEIE
jgi:hypothetical protein